MIGHLAHRTTAELCADRERVVARLFLPGQELPEARSRAAQVVARVMALDDAEVDSLAATLLGRFTDRHPDYEHLLIHHASIIASHVEQASSLTKARTVLLGASFTAEYAIEGAALCNPSAVLHPDQAGLEPGQARVAVSVRGIGEGHVSSIGFCTAVVGPGPKWTFTPRRRPVCAGVATPTEWRRTHLRAMLDEHGDIDEIVRSVLHSLPVKFTALDLERVLAGVDHDLLTRPGAPASVDGLRRLVTSAYAVEFGSDTELDQRILLPSASDESNGMEDARFTRFVAEDGSVDYRATYTAYDGQHVAPRLLTSPDLRVFRAQRLAGPAARNKGMALFPRRVAGRLTALCRSDGESTSVTTSTDGLVWDAPRVVQVPRASWEVLQVGNCGPPIETDRGWLVLTHGVGPMRTYTMGALLLDLDDPSIVLGRLDRPVLEPGSGEQDGYVPNVVYSCGAFLHDGVVWLPYGIGDARIGVAWIRLGELLAALTSVRD